MKPISLYIIFLLTVLGISAQQKPSAFVDKRGVLRWEKGKREIAEFGVHYALPFSYSYANFADLGLSLDQGVKEDVYHLTRLGLKAYRIHVWDAEITDTLGNLRNNNHLRLLDLTIQQMKERGFKMLLIPLDFYGTREEPYGLGQKYGKYGSFLPEAIKATKNYLYQFMNHVNRYTGIAYKDDPDIIGFELYNEPGHPGFTNKTVVPYINGLVQTVRNTGCAKTIFYCMSIAPHLIDGFLEADIQGSTMQWYSVSHNAGFEFKGNLLTHVDQWPKDSLTDAVRNKRMALASYEIDAADNGYAYTYPMMARSMREVGFQFAAMFSYDPMEIGAFNVEYRTHYMNMAYTPQKAIGLKIAGEIFRNTPRLKQFNRYPADTIFGEFHLSHQQNLAEMVGEEKFLYSNNTLSMPPAPQRLKEIAGYGSSPLVKYEGRGLYFIDKLEEGIWRLEVMPDAIWVDNPFGSPTVGREMSAVVWNAYPMQIDLSDLGEGFTVIGINEENETHQIANGKEIIVHPGVYLLVKQGKHCRWTPDDCWKDITLKEYYVPAESKKFYLNYNAVPEIVSERPHTIYAEVISAKVPKKVELYLSSYAPKLLARIPFKKVSRYGYRVKIPAEFTSKEAMLCYQIAVKQKGETTIYPGGVAETAYSNESKTPGDFISEDMYSLRVVKSEASICLFDAELNYKNTRRSHRHYRYIYHPSEIPGKRAIEVGVNNVIYISNYFYEQTEGRRNDMEQKQQLTLRATALSDKPVKAWIVIQSTNGLEYGKLLTLEKGKWNYTLPITELKQVRVIGPGEKGFIWVNPFDGEGEQPLRLQEAETLKVAVLPAENGAVKADARALFEYVMLE